MRFGNSEWLSAALLLLYALGAVADDAASASAPSGPDPATVDSKPTDGEVTPQGFAVVGNLSAVNTDQINDGSKFIDLSTGYAIQVDNVTTEDADTTLAKRGYHCKSHSYSYTQTQVVRHGEWWSPWERTNNRFYCDRWGRPSTSLDCSFGFKIEVDIGIGIEAVISAMLGIGVHIDKSCNNHCDVKCGCRLFSPPWVWKQNRYTWCDTQQQRCTKYVDCKGERIVCQPWGRYQRTNAPYKGGNCDSYNFGCWGGLGW